jgi:hypothetical protein
MAISTASQTLAANYRYFLCDLVTNQLLTEIPFRNVTYGRSIREAGSFTGDIPVSPDTENLDLYNSTLPGKTALYVVRNNVCVWGGMVWSRSYDIKNKILNISANEFTSYLYHRVAWKTWDNAYAAKITLTNGVGKAELLDGGTFDFTANMPIDVAFGLEINKKYDGYFYVKASPAPTDSVIYFTAKDSGIITLANPTDEGSTITVRQDTYDYARGLLEALELDFFGPIFENSEIEPAQTFSQEIASISRTSNIATITFTKSHYLLEGQGFTIRNVSGYSGRYAVLSVPTETTITFASVGANGSTTYTSTDYNVSLFSRAATGVVTLTTTSAHGYITGDLIDVEGVSAFADGTWVVTGSTSTTVSYQTDYVTALAPSVPSGATVSRRIEVRYGSYGEYSTNSGLNVDFSTDSLSTQSPKFNAPFRGFELKYVGEILEEYSNVPGGFEYRIDCDFDVLTNSFTRTFVFLPMKPDSLTNYINSLAGKKLPAGQYAPLSAFNATNTVFEQPGNVLNATMVESAEDAATRFWVQGDDDTDNTDASLPYAAETDFGLLADGWPLLDQVEKIDGISEEAKLYDTYATRFLREATPPISSFTITVDGSVRPTLGTYNPGDWCSVIIDDQFVQLRMLNELEPGASQANRKGILLRKIDAFEVSIPDTPTVPEEVTLTLVTEPDIDRAGASVAELTLESFTSNSVVFTVTVDTERTASSTVTLLRGATLLKTWTLGVGDIVYEQYTSPFLPASTKVTYTLKIDGVSYDTLTVTTRAA